MSEIAHQNHTDYIRVLAISPDGRYVATGGHDSKVIIMDIESKSIIKQFSLGVHVYDIDFSPDGGSMVIARGYNSSSFVYRTDTWDSIGEIDGLTQKTYEQYRVHGKLSRVLKASQYLVEAKKERGSATPHLIFQFLAQNFQEISYQIYLKKYLDQYYLGM